MQVLALNPFHGGSHQAFLNVWQQGSRHEWTNLTLPARHWKWRMRHAAFTLAKQTRAIVRSGQRFDVIFCTDMLNLPEFLGHCGRDLSDVPVVAYFHENQLTYPIREAAERDLHFGLTNLFTAIAATAVWWNSAYHQQAFLMACQKLCRRLPDFTPREELSDISQKSQVQAPGVSPVTAEFLKQRLTVRSPGPLRIVWVSRWEHDKQPEIFFAALANLSEQAIPFELWVCGENYRQHPACFDLARQQLTKHIRQWGFVENRADYFRILQHADVVGSTAAHEFFGIAVAEAVAQGCWPTVPRSLAYPEVLGEHHAGYHDNTPQQLADRLTQLAEHIRKTDERISVWQFPQATRENHSESGIEFEALPLRLQRKYVWRTRIQEMDVALTNLIGASKS